MNLFHLSKVRWEACVWGALDDVRGCDRMVLPFLLQWVVHISWIPRQGGEEQDYYGDIWEVGHTGYWDGLGEVIFNNKQDKNHVLIVNRLNDWPFTLALLSFPTWLGYFLWAIFFTIIWDRSHTRTHRPHRQCASLTQNTIFYARVPAQ